MKKPAFVLIAVIVIIGLVIGLAHTLDLGATFRALHGG